MNTHIFIDADNTSPELAISYYLRLQKTDIVECECIGTVFPKKYRMLEGDSHFRIYRCNSSKNSSDLWLTSIAMDVISCEKPDRIAIISSDRDFLPLLYMAEQNGVKTTLCIEKDKGKTFHSEVRKMSLNTEIVFLDKKTKKDIAIDPFSLEEDGTIFSFFKKKWNHKDCIQFLFEDETKLLPFVNGMPQAVFVHMVRKVFSLPKRKKLIAGTYKANNLCLKGFCVYAS